MKQLSPNRNSIIMMVIGICLLLPWPTPGFTVYVPIIQPKSRASTFLSTNAPGRVEDIDEWVQWTSDSLQRFHNQSLFDFMQVESIEDVHAHKRYAVLSHGTQDDPIFCYSNVAARDCFQYEEDEFYQLASRYSAPGGGERKDRQAIMADVDKSNLWLIPSGIRQRKDKSLFEFRDVILWNVYNDEGERVGQAAVYDQAKVFEVPRNDSRNK